MPDKVSHLSDEDLCDALACDNRTLRRWRKHPDAPGTNDVAAWAAFKERHGLGRGGSQTKAELQEEKLRRENRLLDLKIAREEGKTIFAEDVKAYLVSLSAKWDQLLTLKLETEIPARLIGKDIVAARAEARAVHDEIREICNAGIVGAEKELAS
jgi:hypothetical protein